MEPQTCVLCREGVLQNHLKEKRFKSTESDVCSRHSGADDLKFPGLGVNFGFGWFWAFRRLPKQWLRNVKIEICFPFERFSEVLAAISK